MTSSTDRSRTILWSVPRSLSTATTKCLSAIPGIEVWFEPYNFGRSAKIQLRTTLGVDLPPDYEGNEGVYRQAAQELDTTLTGRTKPQWLSFAYLKRMLENSESQHVFVKDIGSGLKKSEYHLLPRGFKHTFLIRHPLPAFRSYRKAVFNHYLRHDALGGNIPTEENFDFQHDDRFARATAGIFYGEIHELWMYVRQNLDDDPVVIDFDDLLRRPADILPKYCRAVGLPYDDSLLHWDASIDVVKSWKCAADDFVEKQTDFHEHAAKSSEFSSSGKSGAVDHHAPRQDDSPDVIRCAAQVMEYYQDMHGNRLTP